MWNLKAVYDNKTGKGVKEVTIIACYYDPNNRTIYFIDIDEDGNFINNRTSYFRALKGLGV
jgi:hypothetical protein